MIMLLAWYTLQDQWDHVGLKAEEQPPSSNPSNSHPPIIPALPAATGSALTGLQPQLYGDKLPLWPQRTAAEVYHLQLLKFNLLM